MVGRNGNKIMREKNMGAQISIFGELGLVDVLVGF